MTTDRIDPRIGVRVEKAWPPGSPGGAIAACVVALGA